MRLGYLRCVGDVGWGASMRGVVVTLEDDTPCWQRGMGVAVRTGAGCGFQQNQNSTA